MADACSGSPTVSACLAFPSSSALIGPGLSPCCSDILPTPVYRAEIATPDKPTSSLSKSFYFVGFAPSFFQGDYPLPGIRTDVLAGTPNPVVLLRGGALLMLESICAFSARAMVRPAVGRTDRSLDRLIAGSQGSSRTHTVQCPWPLLRSPPNLTGAAGRTDVHYRAAAISQVTSQIGSQPVIASDCQPGSAGLSYRPRTGYTMALALFDIAGLNDGIDNIRFQEVAFREKRTRQSTS